ncbi:hypothetical protein V6N13_042519 [Hibiscus sabdariffa]|uniref:Uncharacterized protein n=1 Tax=Hibiscus sabdariffa TaxID=183260 RepID=A0ABR2G4L4_9ROSI
MAASGRNCHLLVFPFPAQGHMIPLLDFTHRLALATTAADLTITILVTPKNLPFLTQLLSSHPRRIQPLLLPFPPHPSIPSGVENFKDLPQRRLTALIHTLSQLYHPLLSWFQSHPSPPSVIVSDMFLGWTQRLASLVGSKHIVFSPSGAMALSVLYSLWTDLPMLDGDNLTAVVSFDKIPNCPKYPWWKISSTYRACLGGDPAKEFIKDLFHANMQSWGLVINTFSQLERPYLHHLKQLMGSDRVWAVGPLLDLTTAVDRGGSSSVPLDHLLAWLDGREDSQVVYICFGSQVVLTNDQTAAVASALEKSGVHFVWSIKEPTAGHVGANHNAMPNGFEDRVAGRGLIIRGWAPQVAILSHRAVGAFLSHCGWNSVLEAVVAGVTILTWPFGADQFVDQTLLVEELKVADKACEGAEAVPNPDELGEVLANSVSQKNRDERKGVRKLRKAALEATREGGSSAKDMEDLIRHLLSIQV